MAISYSHVVGAVPPTTVSLAHDAAAKLMLMGQVRSGEYSTGSVTWGGVSVPFIETLSNVSVCKVWAIAGDDIAAVASDSLVMAGQQYSPYAVGMVFDSDVPLDFVSKHQSTASGWQAHEFTLTSPGIAIAMQIERGSGSDWSHLQQSPSFTDINGNNTGERHRFSYKLYEPGVHSVSLYHDHQGINGLYVYQQRGGGRKRPQAIVLA